MKIVIDIDIPFISGIFEPYASVSYFVGKEISNKDLIDADVLIIRTRTKCNEDLLKGTSLKLIASATIGLDHIDMQYCNRAGIKVVNAPGCNSGGVLQYVFTALYYLADKKNIKLPIEIKSNKQTFGIIGVGNVGSKVATFAEQLGFEVLRYDPAKELEQTLQFNSGNLRLSDFKDFYSLDYLLENSDIVSVHICMNSDNFNFINDSIFKKMKKDVIFINTSRGEVVDEEALLGNVNKLSGVILDVWKNEPDINNKLLEKVDIATPHIAGYSYEGKVNGTQMVVNEVANFFKNRKIEEF
jgi:Phosphoglycerate dehydrogenase and related dehydrogenases